MIRLEEPSVRHRDSFLAAIEEFRREGLREGPDERTEDALDTYLQRLRDWSQDGNLPEGIVPETAFWIVDGDGYAGRISVRHRLTPSLSQLGGHIGYAVRPGKRGRGYASEALELALAEARAIGLNRVLVTCSEGNVASQKVIEKNDGVLEGTFPTGGRDEATRRYWINL